VLRRIFGHKRYEVKREWRKINSWEPNDLYFPPNTARVIKLKIIRWAWHVARMLEKRGVYKIWWGILKKRGRLWDPGVDGVIILSWVSGSGMLGYGLDFAGSG
jgi:hypothetical protein